MALRLYRLLNMICLRAYPAGSGVKARLLCDGELSGNSIRGYSSVQGLGSHLDKGQEKRHRTRPKTHTETKCHTKGNSSKDSCRVSTARFDSALLKSTVQLSELGETNKMWFKAPEKACTWTLIWDFVQVHPLINWTFLLQLTVCSQYPCPRTP